MVQKVPTRTLTKKIQQYIRTGVPNPRATDRYLSVAC